MSAEKKGKITELNFILGGVIICKGNIALQIALYIISGLMSSAVFVGMAAEPVTSDIFIIIAFKVLSMAMFASGFAIVKKSV